jgi:hypothetical protein
LLSTDGGWTDALACGAASDAGYVPEIDPDIGGGSEAAVAMGRATFETEGARLPTEGCTHGVPVPAPLQVRASGEAGAAEGM